jgi:CrcB protein
MMLQTYLAVMAGGAVGTGMRMALASWLTAKYGETFPIGTLVVNVTGCFVIGAFAALTAPGGFLPAPLLVRQVVMIGVLGGYTTFSAFGLQTLDLIHAGAGLRAALNAALSLTLCLAAVWLGHRLATALPVL